DVALTLLGSLSTLTPDTVTVDIDERRGVIYVHWIDVRTTDPEEAYRLISARLEQKIENLLHIDDAVPPVVMRAADEEGTAQE
ncbi:MAG: hypothetical protein EHM39_13250, partial [Chloroflexi bacterium]